MAAGDLGQHQDRASAEEHHDGDPFRGKSPFDGRGWNLTALPFAEAGPFPDYRLLINQYNEVLNLTLVDDCVPNRGITEARPAENADQKVAALDYTQMIKQIRADDMSDTDGLGGEPNGLSGAPGLAIHHEPGFFLHMKEQQVENLDIARLATIPHGNAATALGRSVQYQAGPPVIPDLSGFPEGVSDDIVKAVNAVSPDDETAYLFPYKHFEATPFRGAVPPRVPPSVFAGFFPSSANRLLQDDLPQNVVRTTILPLDTERLSGGIVNIPFIERQADAASMTSTFWIMELDEADANGDPRLMLAYSQFIFLDFFPRRDGRPGLISWPHISINMMEKIADPAVEGGEKAIAAAI